MAQKTKLELTWIGKDNRPRLEPRILLEDAAKSCHADQHFSSNDLFDNRLIFGDNLLALKALAAEFASKIKCIYIDPPFNTGQALEHYDDGVEHSIWLSLMDARLRLLHMLLHSEGTIFVHIDDNELAYLTVLMDEIFGRTNRINIITFKQGAATGHKAINPGCVSTTNFVLLYAKDKSKWTPKRLFTSRERDKRYTQYIVNRDEDFRGWKTITLIKAFAATQGIPVKEARKQIKDNPSLLNDFVLHHADRVIRTARPDYEGVSEAARLLIDESKLHTSTVYRLERAGYSDMYIRAGERLLFYSDKVKIIDGEAVAGEPLTTLWDDLLSNNLHKEGGVDFPKGKKPEALIKRVLDLSTEQGDWVLDSFAGSGTTGAVAHKMGRRWIMVELRDHCDTLILPRLKRVIDGTDLEGVSKSESWKGGGGFRYFTVAPSLLEKDDFGNWVISRKYNPAMLAEAVCKIEGFWYAPSDTVYWQQGHSTETDFIYVTTQTLGREQIEHLSDEVGTHRSLLIACSAFRVTNLNAFANLTLKKIPKAVLHRCEWGHDDYSLEIKNLPKAPEAVSQEVAQDSGSRQGRRRPAQQGATLFALEEQS